MKLLIVGKSGQLARFFQLVLPAHHSLTALDRSQLDLSQPNEIDRVLSKHDFDCLINTAAYTKVDLAETETELAYAVNAEAPDLLAAHCVKRGVPMVHYSTDYVFAGDGERPYREDDPVNPQSVYGASKLSGEQAVQTALEQHLIFRTAWVYAEFGQNFFLTMRRLAAERDQLSIVNDQTGGPTYARSIAECTYAVIDRLAEGKDTPWGIYHMSCAGAVSWFEFADALLRQSGFTDIELKPVGTEAYPTPAKRPAYSVLDNAKLEKAFGVRMPDWREALTDCITHADGVKA